MRHSRQPPNAFNLACTRLHVSSNSLALECSSNAIQNIRNLKVREAKASRFRELASHKNESTVLTNLCRRPNRRGPGQDRSIGPPTQFSEGWARCFHFCSGVTLVPYRMLWDI